MNEIKSGKAKIIYDYSENEILIKYKDDMTAFNGKEKYVFEGKGKINCEITTNIYNYLEANGVETHFVKSISENEQVCKKLKMIPIEFVCRNKLFGSLAKKLGLENFSVEIEPTIEMFFKNDSLDDPNVNDDVICNVLKVATKEEFEYMKQTTLKINTYLKQLFLDINIDLVDFKIEFGKTADGKIVLGDEISPDSCRLIDLETNQHLDKEFFRQNKKSPLDLYEKVLRGLANVK